MGCETSHSDKPLGIQINILDNNFGNSENQKVRQKMIKLQIKFDVFLSIPCFIQEMLKGYTNQIIVSQQFLDSAVKELTKVNFHPNIYVLKNKSIKVAKQEYPGFQIKYYKGYEDIISELIQKTDKRRKSGLNPQFQKNKQHMVLKIFRKSYHQSSQQLIFQQTLKSKNISYQIYHTFSQLQLSFQTKTCKFIVTDYLYHKQVMNLLQNTNTRLICFCQFQQQQDYDPCCYFITNNFLQIVTQIVSQQKLTHLSFVKCSKVYIYSNQSNSIFQYASIIQDFGFRIKLFNDLKTIMKQSKFYFALTLIINPQQRRQVQKTLQKNDYLFKTKIVQIKKDTQNSVKGLRKILKQLKKGYRTQKSITRSIDIIDKHYNNSKFDSIRKQLDKYNIKAYGYHNLNDYIKTQKFVSPYIITNYQQRTIVLRYIKQTKSQSRVILFCNKNYINPQLKQNKQFVYVNCHFGKIINYIKKNYVHNPYILDQDDFQIKKKKEKLNKNNKRISALNWCNQLNFNTENGQSKNLGQLQKNFQFLNVNGGTSAAQILSIQKQFSSLFTLGYSPFEYPQKIRQNFIQSLLKLKQIMKISQQSKSKLQKSIQQIQKLSTVQIINKTLQFFTSQNQLGLKINKSLINVQQLTKEQIMCLKQYMLYVNMNYLTIYRDIFVGNIKLYHYLKSQLISKCQVGSIIINKNYSIFYQYQDVHNTQQGVSYYKIQLQLDCNTLKQLYPEFNPYFRFNQKFIFSPYSLFYIRRIRNQANYKVIQVQYRKNVQFLKSYFTQNLYKSQPNLLVVCQRQLQKSKSTIKNSFLFNEINKNQFSRNILRCKALNCYHSNKLQEAIQYQKQLIIRQQSLSNTDYSKKQWLNYELAQFYYKNKNQQECRRILKELQQKIPNEYLRQKVKLLSRDLRNSQRTSKSSNLEAQIKQLHKILIQQKMLEEKNRQQNKDQMYEVDCNNFESQSQSQQQNIFSPNQLPNQIQCLDLQNLQDFQTMQKQNIQ